MDTVPDSAPAPEPGCLSHFRITTDLCPQALLRILGLIAQHSLIPLSIVCERHDDRVDTRIAIDGLSPERAELLLAKISTIVTVRKALVQP